MKARKSKKRAILTAFAAVPAAMLLLTGCKSMVISADSADRMIAECMDNMDDAKENQKYNLLDGKGQMLAGADTDDIQMYYGGPDEAITATSVDSGSKNGNKSMDIVIRFDNIIKDDMPDKVYISVSAYSTKKTDLFTGVLLAKMIRVCEMYSIDEDTAREFLKGFKMNKFRIDNGEIGDMEWDYRSTAIIPFVAHDYTLILTKK